MATKIAPEVIAAGTSATDCEHFRPFSMMPADILPHASDSDHCWVLIIGMLIYSAGTAMWAFWNSMNW